VIESARPASEEVGAGERQDSDRDLRPGSSSSSPSAPEASVNERGNVVKRIAEEAGVSAPDASPAMTFTVDAIQVDYPCTSDYPQPPENGHFVGLSMRVTTAPEPAGRLVPRHQRHRLLVHRSDGVTVSSVDTIAAFTCAPDDEQLPSGPLGSGQQYVGTVVLDVPETTGIVQYRPLYLSQGGWEWHFRVPGRRHRRSRTSWAVNRATSPMSLP
jgi:hypothetical protein